MRIFPQFHFQLSPLMLSCSYTVLWSNLQFPQFHFQPSLHPEEEVLTIDDGCQPPMELSSADRNVIAATYTHFLLRNIGETLDPSDYYVYFIPN
ncbi:AREL1 [Cordylochernes scorpioides]|uniref:AREL1 n=1 Tax=Cordylochernes scorpioides TaxID=51811 RepID=A0ABY6LSR1_9ARAC|nr:AREL1 [Cordylochernes scorpioides]